MVYFLAIYTIAASAASLRHGRPEATFRGQSGSQQLAAHGAGVGHQEQRALPQLHRALINRRFQRLPGLTSSPKT
jgi:hypothetical protein